ncbi:MAG TPA: PIG-L family deacetylase [Chitinophagaceae bacterium]|nr:PIG-L family deacetylase [Chitinophagaceae bacterium]
MLKYTFCLFLFCATFSKPHAQVTTVPSGEIYLGLQKLNVLGSVLYIAAHPDDENTRLLTYFAKDRLLRTGYLSLTRGDGGQNLIGSEQGLALGLIRTQELLAARRIDGAEQFFTRAFDFGFSKSPEETFTKWDREKILSDVVWVIRKFKPDVIITRFPTTGEGGHGHHTASAILANDAFTAAADAKRFPEQLKWVQPWQAKRIVWNTFNFGSTNTTSENQYKLDVGGFNPVLGKSYGEIAAESRSQHKSQGFGVPRSRGESFDYFAKTGGAAFTTDLFEGVDQTWNKIAGTGAIAQQIQTLISNFDFTAPQKTTPKLVQLYKSLSALPDSYWKTQKLNEVQQLLEQTSGLYLDAFVTDASVAQGDSLRVNISANNRGGSLMSVQSVSLSNSDTLLNKALERNKNFNYTKTLFISPDYLITQPYWLESKMAEGYYNVADPLLIGQPDIQPALQAVFKLVFEGEAITVTKAVKYKYTDPVKGEVYQPLVILPLVSVYMQPDLLLFKNDTSKTKQVVMQVVSNKVVSPKKIRATLRTTNEVTQTDTANTFAKGNIRNYNFQIERKTLPATNSLAYPMFYLDTAATANFLAKATITYEHIPSITYFYSDPVKILNVDLKTVGKNIGYIPGAGDKVPEALEVMGYQVTMLTEKELARTNLAQFDAIITGVRAYNVSEWLGAYYNKIMAYVAGGGNMIVQYNTNNNIGTVRSKIGPYNFNISRNRVTDETAAVTFSNPHAPVLTYPNQITENDFKDWVQERSTYDATDLDTAFKTVLTLHDRDEPADAGSLVTARYGKGYFTYSGLTFFRQLPAGVPGAFRLFANLIALNQKKEF